MIRRRVVLALLLSTASVVSCIDGPFARSNPYDPAVVRSIRLVALVDTVRRVGEHAAFQLVTDPPVSGLSQPWSTDRPDLFSAGVDGRFELLVLPTDTVVATMTTGIANRRASAQVVVAPQ